MSEFKTYVGLNYYCHSDYVNPAEVIRKHSPTDSFLQLLSDELTIHLIKFMGGTAVYTEQDINYHFYKRSNHFWQIPFAAHQYIKNLEPDIVVIQGLIFPLQVMALRRSLGSKAIILLQHQGEVPYRMKAIFQKMADKAVNGYLFTSIENATEWIHTDIIKDKRKCFELPAASVTFCGKDKAACKNRTGMSGNSNFLWVARLNSNKDPFTAINAFEKYAATDASARLYMIYQENNLLKILQKKIEGNALLRQGIKLVGSIEHPELEYWYSAADYFLLSSHREGGSYALMEAMACGCIPIVSDIPASVKMVGMGEAGYIFKAGDDEELFQTLLKLRNNPSVSSEKVKSFFQQEMSAPAIAQKLKSIIQQLKVRQ